MDPVTLLPAIGTALTEAGPWVSLAAGAITLYILERKRCEKLQQKLDDKEKALRKLAIGIAGINAKTLGTLKNVKDAMVDTQAAQNKCEARQENVEKTLNDVENKIDGMVTRLVEVCTHVQAGR